MCFYPARCLREGWLQGAVNATFYHGMPRVVVAAPFPPLRRRTHKALHSIFDQPKMEERRLKWTWFQSCWIDSFMKIRKGFSFLDFNTSQSRFCSTLMKNITIIWFDLLFVLADRRRENFPCNVIKQQQNDPKNLCLLIAYGGQVSPYDHTEYASRSTNVADTKDQIYLWKWEYWSLWLNYCVYSWVVNNSCSIESVNKTFPRNNFSRYYLNYL